MALSAVLAGALGPVVDGILGGLDELITSDEERDKIRFQILKELNKPHVLQALANIQEAKHGSWFVAGWRPGIGWICAVGLAYQFLVLPFASLVTVLLGMTTPVPVLDSSMLMTMTLSLLGLGGLRTVEKVKGTKQKDLGGVY